MCHCLTYREVNEYGVGHVNTYSSYTVGAADDYNGYGGIAYYTSETCGYISGSSITTNCVTDYNKSEIKYVVDEWTNAKFRNNELAIDSLGYKTRLITISELENLGYVYNSSSVNYPKNDNIPNWIWNSNYWYWTMSPFNSNRVWDVFVEGRVSNAVVNYGLEKPGTFKQGVIRPVINVYKSSL